MDYFFDVNRWYNVEALHTRSMNCGYCNHRVAAHLGYSWRSPYSPDQNAYIYICPNCGNPILEYPYRGFTFPGPRIGYDVINIEDKMVASLYEEARNCFAANALTGSVLCCRKILMHVAVSKGAKEGHGFTYYAEFLSTNHFVPPGAEKWVKTIKDRGNEANHQIKISEKSEAEMILLFTGMLLKNVFEFPSMSENFKDGQ